MSWGETFKKEVKKKPIDLTNEEELSKDVYSLTLQGITVKNMSEILNVDEDRVNEIISGIQKDIKNRVQNNDPILNAGDHITFYSRMEQQMVAMYAATEEPRVQMKLLEMIMETRGKRITLEQSSGLIPTIKQPKWESDKKLADISSMNDASLEKFLQREIKELLGTVPEDKREEIKRDLDL